MSKTLMYRGAVYKKADLIRSCPDRQRVYADLTPDNPDNMPPPRAMVDAAILFLRYHVDTVMAAHGDPWLDDEVVDQQVDTALGEWNDWVGQAFNQALKEMELVENE